jgi:opacity protein-like surface antigen
MAKKLISVAVLVAIVTAGAFAAPEFKLSAGAYGDFMLLSSIMSGGGFTQTTTTTAGGFGAFFDATYAELGFGMDFGNSKSDVSGDKGTDSTYLSISLLGKYPFAITDKIALFPMVGFDWNVFLSGTEKNFDTEIKRADLPSGYEDDYDSFLIDLGIGADFALTDALYLRASALYGIKLNSKWEQEMIDDFDVTIFSSGPTLKVGVGYKF